MLRRRSGGATADIHVNRHPWPPSWTSPNGAEPLISRGVPATVAPLHLENKCPLTG